MKSISNAVRNVGDKDKQRVLAILGQLAKVLPDWRAAKDLNARLSQLEAKQKDSSSRVSTAAAQLEEINKNITVAELAKLKIHKIFAIISLGCLALMFFKGTSAAIGVLLFIVNGPIWFWKIRTSNKQISELKNNRTSAERNLASFNDELSSFNREIALTKKEIENRPISLPSIQLSNIAFPINLVEVMGSMCAIDMSGTTRLTELVGVDLSDVGAELEPIALAAQRLSEIPVLLKSSSTDEVKNPVNRLFGEEDEFEKLVTSYTNVLGKVKDVKLPLPLLSRDSSIAKSLRSNSAKSQNVASGSIAIKAHKTEQTSIDDFLSEIIRMTDEGQKTLASLNQTFEALTNTGARYSNARTSSINHLHLNLFDVLNRASWCSKRYYCPRGIQSPQYIQDLIGVQINEAHNLSLEEIVSRLKQDRTIDARIKAKPDLIDELRTAVASLNEFSPDESKAGSNNPSEVRYAYIDDQYQESLKQFEYCLRKILFGSPYPLLSISNESRLFYDPEIEEWKSDVVPHTYTTSQVQKYGQILKIRSELLFPIWDHLWSEKADFRKSELFRTNESLIRMNEKESEKLIEIGNQFRADVRLTRNSIIALSSDIKSQSLEIESFSQGISALGLLSQRQQESLAIHSGNNDDYSELVEEAERKETLLGGEPQAQTMRRGTLSDPMTESMAPQILLAYTDSRSQRLVQQGGT